MKSVLIKCVYIRLKDKTDFTGRIDRRKLLEILAEAYHIPKEERMNVVKELEQQGIIIAQDKFSFTINKKIVV